MDDSPLIPGLPDDVSVICLAHIPLNETNLLPLVCKSWLRAFCSGSVYQARRQRKLLREHLLVFSGSQRFRDGIERPIVLPFDLFDLECQAFSNFPPLVFPLGMRIAAFNKLLSSACKLFFVGEFVRYDVEYDCKLCVFNGFDGQWSVNDRLLQSGHSWLESTSVNGEIFIFSQESRYEEDVSYLYAKKLTAAGKWQTFPDSCFTSFGSDDWIAGSVVLNNKIHFLIANGDSLSFNLTFDTHQLKWAQQPITALGSADLNFNRLAGNFPFAVLNNTLLCVWWVDFGNGNRTANVMKFDEEFQSWLLLALIPNQHKGCSVVSYVLEAAAGRLLVIEKCRTSKKWTTVCSTSLYVLRIDGNGGGHEWELVDSPLGENVSACAVMEL